MSWFSQIASKAENILNQMDQQAAAALSGSASTLTGTLSSSSSSLSSSLTNVFSTVAGNPTSQEQTNSNMNYSRTDRQSGATPSIQTNKSSESILSQFSLIPDVIPSATASAASSTSTSYQPISPPPGSEHGSRTRNSSTSSVSSSFFNLPPNPNRQSTPVSTRSESSNSESRNLGEQFESEVVAPNDDKLMDFLNSPGPKSGNRQGGPAKNKRNAGPNRGGGPLKEKTPAAPASTTSSVVDASASSQDVKNEKPNAQNQQERIRDKDAEIKALGSEITKLNKRNVELETEYKRLEKRLENWKTQFNESNRIIHEMEGKESDLRNQLQAKDSQIEALSLHINQLQEDMAKKQSQIARLEAENEALKSDNQRGENLQERIQALEQELESERKALKEYQTQSMIMIGKREESERQLVDQLSALQREIAAERKRNEQISKELSIAVNKASSIEAEFSEYKAKATKILRSKEELIQTLQSKESTDEEKEDQVAKSLETQCNVLVVELQQLQAKRDELEKELDSLKSTIVPDLEEKNSTLEEELHTLRRDKKEVEIELRETRDELKRIEDELRETKETLTTRIQGRDTEIEKLRKQLLNKRDPSSQDPNDMEIRIKNLTENLIQKQQILEQYHCEKQSLQFQLEKTETRLKEALHAASVAAAQASPMSHSSSSSSIINMGFSGANDPSKSSLLTHRSNRGLLEDDPFDGPVRRKIKRAYTHIDAFGIRMGEFLRAYPAARAFLLVYVLILHMWVFFVLFNYRPEIHEMETAAADQHRQSNLNLN